MVWNLPPVNPDLKDYYLALYSECEDPGDKEWLRNSILEFMTEEELAMYDLKQ